jgi:hypothetical protein
MAEQELLAPPKQQVVLDLLNAGMSTFYDPSDANKAQFLIMENWDQQRNDGIIQTPLRYRFFLDTPLPLSYAPEYGYTLRTDLIAMGEFAFKIFNGINAVQYSTYGNTDWFNRIYPNWMMKRRLLFGLVQDFSAFSHRGRFCVYDYDSKAWVDLTTYESYLHTTRLGNYYGSGGAGYTSATNVATAYEVGSGGTGLTVDITAAGGVVTVIGIHAGSAGTGYAQGDILYVAQAGFDQKAIFKVASIMTGGVVISLTTITRLFLYGRLVEGYPQIPSDGVDTEFWTSRTINAYHTSSQAGYQQLLAGFDTQVAMYQGVRRQITLNSQLTSPNDVAYLALAQPLLLTSIMREGALYDSGGSLITSYSSLGQGRYNDNVTDNQWIVSPEFSSIEEIKKIYNVGIMTLPVPTVYADNGSAGSSDADNIHHPPTPEGDYTYYTCPILSGVNVREPAWILVSKVQTIRDGNSGNNYKQNRSLTWLRISVNARLDTNFISPRFYRTDTDLIKNGHPLLTGFELFRAFEKLMPDKLVFDSTYTGDAKQSEFANIGSHPPRRIGMIDMNCTQGVYGNNYNTHFTGGATSVPDQNTFNDRPFIPNPNVLKFYDGGLEIVFVHGDYWLKLNSKQWDFQVQMSLQEVRYQGDSPGWNGQRYTDVNGVIHATRGDIERQAKDEGWQFVRDAGGKGQSGAVYSVPTIVGVTGDLRPYSLRWAYNDENVLNAIPHLWAYIDYAEGNQIICERLPLASLGIIWSVEDEEYSLGTLARYTIGKHTSPYLKLDSYYKTDPAQPDSDLVTFLNNYRGWVQPAISFVNGYGYTTDATGTVALAYGNSQDIPYVPSYGHGIGAFVDITVSSNVITNIVIHTAGNGSGYAIGDILYVIQAGASILAQVTVKTINSFGGILTLIQTTVPTFGTQLKGRIGIGWVKTTVDIGLGEGYTTDKATTSGGTGVGALFNVTALANGQVTAVGIAVGGTGAGYSDGDILKLLQTDVITPVYVYVMTTTGGALISATICDVHGTRPPPHIYKDMYTTWIPDHQFDLAVEENEMPPLGEDVQPNYGGSLAVGNQRLVWDLFMQGRHYPCRIGYTRRARYGYPTSEFRGYMDIPWDEDSNPIMQIIPIRTINYPSERLTLLVCGKIKSRIMIIEGNSDVPHLLPDEYEFGICGDHTWALCNHVVYGIDIRGMVWSFTINNMTMMYEMPVDYKQIGKLVFDDTMLRDAPGTLFFSEAFMCHERDSYGRDLIKISMHAEGARGSVTPTPLHSKDTDNYAAIDFPGFAQDDGTKEEFDITIDNSGSPQTVKVIRLLSRNAQYVFCINTGNWHLIMFYNDTVDANTADYFVMGCNCLGADGRTLHYGVEETNGYGQIVRECTLLDFYTNPYIYNDYLKKGVSEYLTEEHYQHLRTQWFDGERVVDEKTGYSLVLAQKLDSRMPQMIAIYNDPELSAIYKGAVLAAGSPSGEVWLPMTSREMWFQLFARSGTQTSVATRLRKLIGSYENVTVKG